MNFSRFMWSMYLTLLYTSLLLIILLIVYLYIYISPPASPKVKFNEVFGQRPSFTRTFRLPRFDRAQPFFPSRSSSPSFFHIGRHCAPMHPQFFMVSEPQMTTENYIGSMLNLTWTPFETVAASLESNIFSITFRSQPLMGLSNLQWKATKTDIPELLQSKFVAVSLKKCYGFLRKFPNVKNVS